MLRETPRDVSAGTTRQKPAVSKDEKNCNVPYFDDACGSSERGHDGTGLGPLIIQLEAPFQRAISHAAFALEQIPDLLQHLIKGHGGSPL
jgi:hypothetical protein